MSIGFPTTKYEQNEIRLYLKQVEEVEKAPLAERLNAYHEWFIALADYPDVVAERVRWLLLGNYGQGSYLKAQDVLKSPRMNRVAALAQMTAAMEWQCSGAYARKAWNRLTPQQQERVNTAIGGVIADQEIEIGLPTLKS